MNKMMSRSRLVGIGLLIWLAAGTVLAQDGPALPLLRVEDRRIVDESWSAVILRGVAVNQLGDYFEGVPEVPATVPLTRRDFEGIAALGLNSVRLIVHWSRLEPAAGIHDEEYLAQIREAVGWARDNNIYVILDMHQDAWGKYIASPADKNCPWPSSPNIGWDGAPEWATLTDGKSPCRLAQREIAPAVMQAWKSFWQNRDGTQDRLIETWAWLAEAFKDEPAVAGYDLLNEPNWGFNPASAVHKYKPEFYRRARAAIRRAEDPGRPKIIFFEPLAIWSALPGEAAVPFTDDPNIVYAPHIYLGAISADVVLFHRELIPIRKGFELARREAERFGTTFWNGEWMPGPGDHAWRYAAIEDEYQTGSARWLWKSACGDPHRLSGVWPDQTARFEGETRAVMIMSCADPDHPEGVELGLNPIDAEVLTRPYPRAFPAPAVFTSNPRTREFAITGAAERGGVPLAVWFPGEREPTVASEGIAGLNIEPVPGGFLVTGVPDAGAWSLALSTGPQ
jgi:endoglycosylceramidase